MRKGRQRPEAKTASTYRYRDPDKRRKYMKDYMRNKRAGEKTK